jgi:hypothetical protein
MSRWKLEGEHRRRIRHALQLLTINGALRPADVEVRYRGTERVLGTWTGETNRLVSAAVLHHRSIFHTDLGDVRDTVWSWISTTIPRVLAVQSRRAALAKGFPVTPN